MSNDMKLLFVFYNAPYRFDISDLPGEWKCIDSALIPPLGEISDDKPVKYNRYSYYKGPNETIEEAKKDLEYKLNFSMNAEAIKSYYIQNTFLPIPV